ncbi:MAG: AAA family ATPase [Candidatus Helarchaeota archaeon]|nr:AAA family ATPase [Candidatus Helarchaeota archaeon]
MVRKKHKIRQALPKKEEFETFFDKRASDEIPVISKLRLKPIGYPIRAIGDGNPPVITSDDPELFEVYAREQWSGYIVSNGTFLFDQFLYPDFAFKVVQIEVEGNYATGKISTDTRVTLKQEIKPVMLEHPKVFFKDVVGNQEAKDKCKIIMKYLKNPDKFDDWIPKNILLYGPPGTGKTMMARALACETDVPILLTKATELIGLHVGDGARRIHQLYSLAKDAGPSIIFIDELDAIALDRRYQSIRGDVSEVVNALLSELDGLSSKQGIVTICATNAPSLLDSAVRNRFEEEILFDLPSFKERLDILKLYSGNAPIQITADLSKIAKETNDFSGRELKDKILKGAIHLAILRDEREVSSNLFNEILTRIQREKKLNKNKILYG